MAHRLASRWSDDDAPVFPGSVGGYTRATTLYRTFAGAAEAAGVPWARWHALRHTAASAWLAAGIPIAQVSALLGHANVAVTLGVYAHAVPGTTPTGDELAQAVGFSGNKVGTRHA